MVQGKPCPYELALRKAFLHQGTPCLPRPLTWQTDSSFPRRVRGPDGTWNKPCLTISSRQRRDAMSFPRPSLLTTRYLLFLDPSTPWLLESFFSRLTVFHSELILWLFLSLLNPLLYLCRGRKGADLKSRKQESGRHPESRQSDLFRRQPLR